jgi:hypothetical protein
LALFKKIALGVGAAVLLLVAGGGVFVYAKASEFDASMSHVYDVPVPAITRSTDPAVLERGKHLSQSVAGCATHSCHGTDLGGGKPINMGPVGVLAGPNISEAGVGAAYSDGELVRLIQHGIRKDGTSLRFMPADEIGWLPQSDVVAVVSYLRSLPPVEHANEPIHIGLLGKVLDRLDKLPLDVARRIDHEHLDLAGPPEPTAEYGKYLSRLCTGCHGKGLSGGRIPGAPSKFPVPLNLTPDASGMLGWTYEDFARLLDTGIRKNGKQMDPFMPIDAFGKFDDVERHALFAYLAALPPRPLGGR